MKNTKFSIIIIGVFSAILCTVISCNSAYYISKAYGDPVPYGEGKHPGIDFDVPLGTPVIAAAGGKVVWIGDPCSGQFWCGDRTVWIRHGDFISIYSHLKKVFVRRFQVIKRGELIGLSGASNNDLAHLHFGLVHPGGFGMYYSQTYNPNDFWLGGKMQCFDPSRDYSGYSAQKLTLPVACGKYRKALIKHGKH